LQQRLRSVSRVRALYRDLPPSTCPWVYPVLFDGLDDAHLSLRKRGIPAVTWGGVRPTILEKGRFAHADFLYENLVFLPVHQNLGERDLDLIAAAVLDTTSNRPDALATAQLATAGGSQ